MKSFLTKIFPFLKRNGRWRHSRLDKNDDLTGSKWSFVSSTATDIVEIQDSALLGNVPSRNKSCRGAKVNWLPLTGSEPVRAQNGKPEQRPRKKVKKFRLRIRFGKKKCTSSDVGRTVTGLDCIPVDNVKEEGDNRANEERIRQMATPSEAVLSSEGCGIKTSSCGKTRGPYSSRKETKKRTTKAKDRFKNKRTRKDNYETIEDEQFGNDEAIANDDNIPCVSHTQQGKDTPDQGRWNVEFSRQLSDSIWCPETMAPYNKSMECLHPKSAKNGRKRSSKIKEGKAKKVIRNRYEKLNSSTDHLESVMYTGNRRTSNRTKQVKGGAWKMCKNGWKTMKSGLVYYSKAPVIKANFNPVLNRYEDGFKEFKDNGLS